MDGYLFGVYVQNESNSLVYIEVLFHNKART